jgi:hypothetical protein
VNRKELEELEVSSLWRKHGHRHKEAEKEAQIAAPATVAILRMSGPVPMKYGCT